MKISPRAQGMKTMALAALLCMAVRTDGALEYGSGPHVDVYFIDDQAYTLTWWYNGSRKSVRLTFIE
jgi:hypothetical protein